MQEHFEGVKVPESVSEITIEWLREVLKDELSAHEITSIEIDKNFKPTGLMGKTVRVTIGYVNEPGEPKSVIVKFQFGCNNPKRETEIYHLLSEAGVKFIPRVYGTFGDGNLVLEDLTPTHFVVKEDEDLTIDQVRSVLTKLAILNSTFWNDSPVAKPDLSRPINIITLDMREENWDVFKRRYHTQLGQEASAFEWLRENPETVARFYRSGTQTMTHGDLHKGNLLFPNTGSTEPTFIDWQHSGQKVPGLDVVYFIVKELTIKQRREHEYVLLKEYYDLLSEHIRAAYTFDHAWLNYRACIFQSIQNVVMYVGPKFNNHPDRFESADRMAERIIAAVRDLKPVEAIRELQEHGWLKSEQTA